jgi:hypothetical protein
MRNISDETSRQNQNTFYVQSFFFFRKSCCLRDNVETFCRAGQARDDNIAHAHCMLDTYSYKHTLTICNTYCSSTTTVTQTRLNITLYVHRLSCATFIPPKLTPFSVLREARGPGRPYTRTLAVLADSLSQRFWASHRDVCVEISTHQPAQPVTLIIIINNNNIYLTAVGLSPGGSGF